MSSIKRCITDIILLLVGVSIIHNMSVCIKNILAQIIKTDGFIVIVISIIFFMILNRVIYPYISDIGEYLRRSIIDPYMLNPFQTNYRIAVGSEVYAESYKHRKYIMISGTGERNTTLVKDLSTGKEAICFRDKLLESLKGLIDDEDYRFYDPDSYKKMLERGYKLNNAESY